MHDMTDDLFADDAAPLILGPESLLLQGYAKGIDVALHDAITRLTSEAPWRQMVTPGGFTMSVGLTSCGALGWISDVTGYRYSPTDPLSGRPWPAMPEVLRSLARSAAAQAGFPAFEPDACLINRYLPGSKMSLHQDKDERDLQHPIVSVSLGIAATFLFGGLRRRDPTIRVPLTHGDVVVWGGVDRLRFHGVTPVKDGTHPLIGSQRINLTFRKAG